MILRLFYYCLIFSLFLWGCTSNKSLSGVYTSNTCDNNYQAVGFDKIIDSIAVYDGRFVELSGYFNWGSEMVALSKRRNSSNTESMIWMSYISAEIVDSLKRKSGPQMFKNLNQIRITIKGKVDMGNKGHLDQFACGITGICYIKVW